VWMTERRGQVVTTPDHIKDVPSTHLGRVTC
jgi:hypothetical protein